MAEQPLTYEQARQRLIEVVQTLESGSVPLSTSMELWQEAETLARICQEWLDGARARIESTLRETDDVSPDAPES